MIAGFSPDLAHEERALKTFLYANLYHHESQRMAADAASQVISRLFVAYRGDADLLPSEWRRDLPVAEPQRTRHIADFLAGMTDRYALRQYETLFGRDSLPETLSYV